MIILANLLGALAAVLNAVFYTLTLLIFVRVILSWVNADPYNPLTRFVISSTDPLFRLLGPLPRYVNRLGGGRIDWSPLLLLLLIIFLQSFLVPTLADYSLSLRRSALIG